MAFVQLNNAEIAAVKRGEKPGKYMAEPAFIDSVNKPHHLEDIAETYGDQLISGPMSFTSIMGVPVDEGQADSVYYWEKPRLHAVPNGTIQATSPGDTGTKTITTVNDHNVKDNDVVLLNGKVRCFAKSTGAKTYTVQAMDSGGFGVSFAASEFVKAQVIGSLFEQGADAPKTGELSNIVRYEQPFALAADAHVITGSQMGNKAWFKDTETGQFYYDIVGLEDFYKRYENKLEAQAIFGQKAGNQSISDKVDGFDGYFATVEERGIVWNGYITSLTELDYLTNILDKQGGASEYAWFQNTNGCTNFSNLVSAAQGGEQPSYGAFPNTGASGEDMAIKLGFKSFSRGGRTWHNKKLQVLQDPTWGGQTEYYKGVMTPLDKVTDAKSNIQVPSLQMFVKSYHGGNRRWKEFFISQSGVNGEYIDGGDRQTIVGRSEYNLVTRAANRHVIQRGG